MEVNSLRRSGDLCLLFNWRKRSTFFKQLADVQLDFSNEDVQATNNAK